MTEAEWLACSEVDGLWRFVGRGASRRKARLFAVACCRQIERYIQYEESQAAVDVSELFADEEATSSQLRAARRGAAVVAEDLVFEASVSMRMSKYASKDAARAAVTVAETRLSPVSVAAAARAMITSTPERPKDQAGLLRDIFGNPFRPVAVDPAWLTSTVVQLARQMYELRDFAAMPILADALQDAGCSDEDILGHLRGPGPHVRGCWVVDLLLGKV